jgi:transglutaminase-like putative cysteine protease
MNKVFTVLFLVLFCNCSSDKQFQKDKELIFNTFEKGEFSSASLLIRAVLDKGGLNLEQESWLNQRQAMMDRIRLDFSRNEKQIRTQLSAYYPILPDSLLTIWENSGHLEMRNIDGAKKYFKYAVSNLFRLDSEASAIRRKIIDIKPDPLDSIRIENSSDILKYGQSGQPAEKRKVTIEFTIIVDADAVPAGEEVYCWLPFPKESPPRQTNITLLASNPAEIMSSGANQPHSSLFAVKQSVPGQPTLFSYKASFEISGQWFDLFSINQSGSVKVPAKIKPYTREELPHVAFTPAVIHLADSLAAKETDPARIFRLFFYWIDQNIPWASALEYSTFECIPDYVIKFGHGDCGMKTFLLMSMARYKGIPIRWQSGWMLHPGEENLHDWAEIWFSQTGWVPVDMSFGLQKTDAIPLKEFYMTGIDSYRMIINDGFAQDFNPPKKFFRSEPFDFQRGEVEWSQGNLYFNQWDYKLNVISIEK